MLIEIHDPLFIAFEFAAQIATNPEYFKGSPYPDHTMQSFNELRPHLLRFKDESPYCAVALENIEKLERYWIERATAKRTAKRKRQEVAYNYNDLFVATGKRDGFCCKECGVVTDLQIDHIKPIAMNGTNDLDNLQLLCGPCNLAKSDKWGAE